MVQPHALLTPTPFQSPDWDSRFPLIAPQRRSLWLPQACSAPVPLLSGPPPCSSLAEKAQGWGQVGRYLWPGGRGTGLGQSPSQRARPGRALGSWSKERSGVKAMNPQACAHFPRLHPRRCPLLTHKGSGRARIPARWRRGRAQGRLAPAPSSAGAAHPAPVNPGACAR